MVMSCAVKVPLGIPAAALLYRFSRRAARTRASSSPVLKGLVM